MDPATEQWKNIDPFNQILFDQWAYNQAFDSNPQRLDSLPSWPHEYNRHPLHTEVDGRPASHPPTDNFCGKDS